MDECFVACLGTILASFSNFARAELFPSEQVSFVETFGLEWGPKNAVPVQLELRSLAFDVEKHYMAKVLIKELPKNATDAVLIRATLLFVYDDLKLKKEAELKVKLVASPDQLGQPVKTVFDNLVRVEAAQVLKEAEDDMSRGDQTHAHQKIDDYNAKLDTYACSAEMKQKLKQIVVKSELQSKKMVTQTKVMLQNEEWVPGMINAQSMNQGQQVLMKKLHK